MVFYSLFKEKLARYMIYFFMQHLSDATSSCFMPCWIKHLLKSLGCCNYALTKSPLGYFETKHKIHANATLRGVS